jgi:hypothetical protein
MFKYVVTIIEMRYLRVVSDFNSTSLDLSQVLRSKVRTHSPIGGESLGIAANALPAADPTLSTGAIDDTL